MQTNWHTRLFFLSVGDAVQPGSRKYGLLVFFGFFVILMSCCVTSHIFILLNFINLASAFIPSLSQNRGLLNRAHPLSAMQTAVTQTHMLRRNEGTNPRGVKKREDAELQWSAVFMSFYILFAGAITQSSHCVNI